jgi:hypothetical protein
VQEWIKENPAFSGTYEDLLGFDEWIDKNMIEFINWYAMTGSWIEENLTSKQLLEIFKKEKNHE